MGRWSGYYCYLDRGGNGGRCFGYAKNMYQRWQMRCGVSEWLGDLHTSLRSIKEFNVEICFRLRHLISIGTFWHVPASLLPQRNKRESHAAVMIHSKVLDLLACPCAVRWEEGVLYDCRSDMIHVIAMIEDSYRVAWQLVLLPLSHEGERLFVGLAHF